MGVDFHIIGPGSGFTREKVVRVVIHHGPVSHTGQWQSWGQKCVTLNPRVCPLSYVDLKNCHYSGCGGSTL